MQTAAARQVKHRQTESRQKHTHRETERQIDRQIQMLVNSHSTAKNIRCISGGKGTQNVQNDCIVHIL